tara:strand:- start:985 stop:1155 length:171 start_codon:yes stop_codon:yes gene_type:complete
MNKACKRYGKKPFDKTSYATYRPQKQKDEPQRERQESAFLDTRFPVTGYDIYELAA